MLSNGLSRKWNITFWDPYIYLNETWSKVCVGKTVSNTFLIDNGKRQGDALLVSVFDSVLKYTVRKNQENQVGQIECDISDSDL
jgi:hypothetical protein